MTRIKFCGLTREEDVLFADTLGVDYIGFIFVPTSKRSVTIECAKKLRSHLKYAKAVGVFLGQSDEKIASISREIDLDICQVYDAPASLSFHLPEIPIIHAFRNIPEISTLQAIEPPHAILLDGQRNGECSHHERIAQLPISIRHDLFLAGGLTPQNVLHAIKKIRPFGVDICSGIETSPGKKNPDLMRLFVDTVRSLPT